MGHVGIGVQWLHERGHDRVLAELPAEALKRAVQPKLEGLRHHRPRVLEHRCEAWIAGVLDQLAADRLERAHRDSEHDELEVLVLAPAQGQWFVAERVRLPLKIDPSLAQLLAVHDLLSARFVRPAIRALGILDGHKRLVLRSLELHLRDHLDLLDEAPVPGELYARDRVKELKTHAAATQDLVEGDEHGVAHSRLHLPADRPAIREEQAQCILHSCPCRHRRAGYVTVFIRKRHVVKSAYERPLSECDRLCAVAAQPGAQVFVIDLMETTLDQPVLDDALQHRRTGIEHREEEAQVIVVLARLDDLSPKPALELIESVPQQRAVNILTEAPYAHRAAAAGQFQRVGDRLICAARAAAQDPSNDVRREAIDAEGEPRLRWCERRGDGRGRLYVGPPPQ